MNRRRLTNLSISLFVARVGAVIGFAAALAERIDVFAVALVTVAVASALAFRNACPECIKTDRKLLLLPRTFGDFFSPFFSGRSQCADCVDRAAYDSRGQDG